MTFGRLERSSATTPMSDINMTPLIDVMLVLVVIFILTAPLLVSSVRLQLPSTDAASPSEAAQSIKLAVDSAGVVYLDSQPVSTEVLKLRLAQTASLSPQTEVELRADESVPYGRVVEVMGMAQKAGLNRIGFVAQP
jgi:biopolymer transport protein TolR